MKPQTHVEQIFSSVFGNFTMNEFFEANRIGLSDFVKLPNGTKTKIIKPGDEVLLMDGELVDCPIKCEASHLIMALYCNLANTEFEIMARDNKTNELVIVKI